MICPVQVRVPRRSTTTIYADAINNFSAERLPNGDWITTRRDVRFKVTILIGGRKRNDWQAFPVVRLEEVKGFRPYGPIIWAQPDQTLVALFRDSGGSQPLFRATSVDLGKTWAKPVMMNFPNGTSELFSLSARRPS